MAQKKTICILTDFMIAGGLERVVCEALDALIYGMTFLYLLCTAVSALKSQRDMQGKSGS